MSTKPKQGDKVTFTTVSRAGISDPQHGVYDHEYDTGRGRRALIYINQGTPEQKEARPHASSVKMAA